MLHIFGLKVKNNKTHHPHASSGSYQLEEPEKEIQPQALCEKILCHKILLGSSTIEIIRQSIINSSEQLDIEINRIHELNQKNDNARSALQSLIEFISDISKTSSDARVQMEALDCSLDKINSCINDIQKIARQTNLIAINSAIEAARVGNTGRGFSVISREIKRLSDDVHRSSKDVHDTTTVVQRSATNTSEVLMQQKTLLSDIQHNISDVVDSIGLVINKSTEMKAVMEYISTVQFLNIVKIDHVIWKLEIYRLLLNKTPDKKVTMHNQCRLGKWYYGNAQQTLSDFDSFRTLEKPHREVHESGCAALREYTAGNIEKMSLELDSMEMASNDVIRQLEQLINDLKVKTLSH